MKNPIKQAVISRYERFEAQRKSRAKEWEKPIKSSPRCPFEGRCSSYPDRCKDCVHNPEPDHFEPKGYPDYPYPYPWWKRRDVWPEREGTWCKK